MSQHEAQFMATLLIGERGEVQDENVDALHVGIQIRMPHIVDYLLNIHYRMLRRQGDGIAFRLRQHGVGMTVPRGKGFQPALGEAVHLLARHYIEIYIQRPFSKLIVQKAVVLESLKYIVRQYSQGLLCLLAYVEKENEIDLEKPCCHNR